MRENLAAQRTAEHIHTVNGKRCRFSLSSDLWTVNAAKDCQSNVLNLKTSGM